MTDISTPERLIKDAEKKFGKGALIKGSELKHRTFQRAPSGSLAFDLVLGGGWPLNCWCEIVGNESSGKTVMALKTIAACQALNPEHLTLWVAAEEFVGDWAEKLGVDLDRILLAETNISEDALQIVIDVQDARGVDAIVIDSLPAMSPSPELEAGMGDLAVGLHARINNQFFRKTGKSGRRSLIDDDRDCLLLVINQWRDKIGTYGDPRTTPGGQGKNYAFFIRVEVSRTDWINGPNKIKFGQTIKARAFKNKTSAPQRTGEVDFYFDALSGFSPGDYDVLKEVFLIATAYDVIESSGNGFYSFRDERLATDKGKEYAIERLRWDLTLQEAVTAEVHRVVLHLPV